MNHAHLIIEHKIPKVVIGCIDSFSKVSGKGIEKLKNEGIDVSVGVLEKECLELNKRFFTFHNKKRPYIILKWAETKDGFIDVDRTSNLPGGKTNIDNWITSPLSKKLVHKWRSEEAGIMVATNTAINDNPSLNVREWSGKNPLRVVLDLNNRLPKSLNLLDGSTPTLIFTSNKLTNKVNIEYYKIDVSSNVINQVLEVLHQKNIQSIIIEGGKQLLQSFIDNNTWDEARVFVGEKRFVNGLTAPQLNNTSTTEQAIGTDKLSIYNND